MSRKLLALATLSLTLLAGCSQPQSQSTPPATSAVTTPAEAPTQTASPETTPSESAVEPFQKKLELQEHTFEVTSSGNQLTITPSGLESNEPQTVELDGPVLGADVADMNADGFPEVYVYSRTSKGQGRLVAYSSNNGKSITPINLPPIEQVKEAGEGYRGGDELRVIENRLVQRWPVFKEGDPDDKPSGGIRQIQWRLEPGEATWTLVPDKVVNY
ncbi:hypothetical protein DYH09_07550 [bacterium CPR1]|nr:hypothetical protein [bacterium CPR1]